MGNSPSTHQSALPFLGKLAEVGMIVECGCYGCRRRQTYLAADLAAYIGPQAVVGELWSACPHCGTGANWWERYRHPSNADVVNGTIIRKLVGFRSTAVWRDEPYSAPGPKPDPDAPKQWRGLL